LLRSRRQELHRRITATLERHFPEIVEMQPELLARHCTEAGLVEKAVGNWVKAGEQAIARAAMLEAVAQLRKGLDLLSSVPNNTARQERELDLQIALGNALIATKGYAAPEAGEAFARARDLCERLNRPSRLGLILEGQFSFRLVRGELEQSKRHAEEIRHLGEAMWTCFGSTYSAATHFFLGRFTDARADDENALSLWDPTYRASVTPRAEDPCVVMRMRLSRTLLCLGYLDQACLRRQEALAEARQLSPYTLAWALSVAWQIHWAMEEGVTSAARMLRSAEELRAIAGKYDFPYFFAIGNIMRGWGLGTGGQSSEGILLLLEGLTTLRTAGCSLLLPLYLTMLAGVYGKAAQPQEGLSRLTEADTLVETTQERWAEAEMHRVRATLLLSLHEHAAAEDSYHRALAVARRQSAKFWELRAASSLARLWRDQGRRTEARDLLEPIYGWFTEGLDAPVLQDAKALLEQLA
jgi:predicted ATPase